MEHPTGVEPALVLRPFPVTFLSVRSGGGYGCILAAQCGFEPQYLDSESSVLPLDERAIVYLLDLGNR